MMEEKTFFGDLRSFCCNLEQDLREGKRGLSTPCGMKPGVYYKGMEVLRNEVLEIKKLHATTTTKVKELPDLESFLEDLKSRFQEEEKKILNIEKHLVKYGYVPLQDSPDTGEESVPEDRPDNLTDGKRDCTKEEPAQSLVSPELSHFSNRHLHGPSRKYTSPPKNPMTGKDCESESACNFTPMSTTKKRNVRNWLSTIEDTDISFSEHEVTNSSSCALSQNLKRMNSEQNSRDYFRNKMKVNDSEKKMFQLSSNSLLHVSKDCPMVYKEASSSIAAPSNQCFNECHSEPLSDKSSETSKKGTPQEPSMSSFTAALLDLDNKGGSETPEEPSLSGFPLTSSTSTVEKRKGYSGTPEEPGLSSFSHTMPEKESKGRSGTPEEPGLSSFSSTSRMLSDEKLKELSRILDNPYQTKRDVKLKRDSSKESSIPFTTAPHYQRSKDDNSIEEKTIVSIFVNKIKSEPSSKSNCTKSLDIETHAEKVTQLNSNPNKLEINVCPKEGKKNSLISSSRLNDEDLCSAVDFCPESPQLSDVTQKLFNLRVTQMHKALLPKDTPSISSPGGHRKHINGSIDKENLFSGDQLPPSPMLSDTTMRIFNLKRLK